MTDLTPTPSLTERQETILGLIVRDYVEAPTPVSSKALVENHDLGVSSATVRNDMAVLEEYGLIASPHTSAGRIPTEAGYRYFVQRLIRGTELSREERRLLRREFEGARPDLQQALQVTASALAQVVRSASLVTAPRLERAAFKHLQLIHTQGRSVLMVLVVEGGTFRQRILQLAEPVTQPQLARVSAVLNRVCAGLTASEIRQKAPNQPALESEIMGEAATVLDSLAEQVRIIYTDGLTNILDPGTVLDQMTITDPRERSDLRRALETTDSAGARQTLRLLEDQPLLESLLADILPASVPGLIVLVSGDERYEALHDTSVVLGRYGIEGRVTGALGVIGPTRLRYGRAVSAVRFMAGLMSDLIIDVLDEAPPGEIDIPSTLPPGRQRE